MILLTKNGVTPYFKDAEEEKAAKFAMDEIRDCVNNRKQKNHDRGIKSVITMAM